MSELLNLNNTTPAAPSGYENVSWQKSATPSGTDPISGFPYYDASAYVPSSVGAVATHDEPLTDGNANFIFDATLSVGGDVIVCIGVPN